jgi:chromosomal replication initiator protein DnaA
MPATMPPGVKRKTVAAPPKMKKVKKRVSPAGQAQGLGAPGQEAISRPAAPPIIKKAPVERGTAAKPQLLEDTIGEEELFKKLAKWDKDLKQKVTAKKIPSSAAAGAVKAAPKTEGEMASDLERREKELQKFEAKLREKEKKIKKMEDMNKLFTQIEDTELEQFAPAGAGVGGAATAGQAITIPEGEVKDYFETEELLQPLKNLTFTNFIVGPSNRFAHDVALSVAKTPADAYNPLFIYSPVGLGKTHLLCAIGNYIKSKQQSMRIVYASSEKFTNELLDCLRMGEMEKFREKYRNVDVLLIDDIQFIGGQEGTQEEFFHTFNSLYNAHKQIVITSDRPPKNIAHLKDRLRSRFEGGLIVNIKAPDLGTRTMILHEKAEKEGIYIPDEIVNYIAAKVKSNVRTLIGVLNRVVAHSSLTDRELEPSLVDEVLKDVLDELAALPET